MKKEDKFRKELVELMRKYGVETLSTYYDGGVNFRTNANHLLFYDDVAYPEDILKHMEG